MEKVICQNSPALFSRPHYGQAKGDRYNVVIHWLDAGMLNLIGPARVYMRLTSGGALSMKLAVYGYNFSNV